MPTIEVLIPLPSFKTGDRVQMARQTRRGPSFKRVDPTVYEVVDCEPNDYSFFAYTLRDVATGQLFGYHDWLTGEYRTSKVYQKWLRPAR